MIEPYTAPSPTHLQATGTVFLGHAKPVASLAKDGSFQLTLRAMDRFTHHGHGRSITESWLLLYSGPAAQLWWQAHQTQLQPGQPLHVRLSRIRALQSNRSALPPELTATVEHLALAPLAAHMQARQNAAAPASVQAAPAIAQPNTNDARVALAD